MAGLASSSLLGSVSDVFSGGNTGVEREPSFGGSGVAVSGVS